MPDASEAERYPLHVKMAAIPESDRQALGQFLEWLDSEGLHFCKEVKTRDVDGYDVWDFEEVWDNFYGDKKINVILGKYYEVDYDELQKEKELMLLEVRMQSTLRDIEKAGEDA